MLEQQSLLKVFILYLLAIFFTSLNLSNIKIAGITDILPLFDLMIIFYFTIFKNRFGMFFVFLLGIWNDSLNGNSLGLTSLCYILIIKFFIIFNNRILTKENFNQIWQQFIGFCFTFLFLKWMIFVVINGSYSSVFSLFVQFIISSILYVIMHVFLDYVSNKLLGEDYVARY